MLYDDYFYNYTYKPQGIKKFVEQFTTTIINDTYLFGKLHSINDNYALCDSFGKYWYYQGKEHRENDLPSKIYKSGTKIWCYHGELHRENDLPTVISFNGDKYWYYHGGTTSRE